MMDPEHDARWRWRLCYWTEAELHREYEELQAALKALDAELKRRNDERDHHNSD